MKTLSFLMFSALLLGSSSTAATPHDAKAGTCPKYGLCAPLFTPHPAPPTPTPQFVCPPFAMCVPLRLIKPH